MWFYRLAIRGTISAISLQAPLGGTIMGQSAVAKLAAFVLTSAIFILVASPAKANDTTVSCNSPPDKGAAVAVHPGTQVSVTQDSQSGTCTFAINGAVATSPPAREVISALNLFRGQSRGFLRDKDTAAFAIAALMAASSPVDDVPKDLVDALRNTAPTLMDCLSIFFEKRDLPSARPGGGALSCRGIPPYRDKLAKHDMLRRDGTAVGEPTLEISMTWQRGRFRSKLYLPLTMLALPQLPNP